MDRPKHKNGFLAYGHRKAVNEDGSVRFRFTEKVLDRHEEVVMPMGARLDDYKKNPLALWAHGWGASEDVPIGKTLIDSIEITEDYFDANIMFDESGDDKFAKMIASKVKNGFLNACSIGFRPIVISNEPVIEGQTGPTFLEWELFEISICSIPANPNALVLNSFNQFTEYRQACVEKMGEKEFNEIISKEMYYLQNKQEKIVDKKQEKVEGIENYYHTLNLTFESMKLIQK